MKPYKILLWLPKHFKELMSSIITSSTIDILVFSLPGVLCMHCHRILWRRRYVSYNSCLINYLIMLHYLLGHDLFLIFFWPLHNCHLLYRQEAIKRTNGVYFSEEVVTLAAKLLLFFFLYTYIFYKWYWTWYKCVEPGAKDASMKSIKAPVLKAQLIYRTCNCIDH